MAPVEFATVSSSFTVGGLVGALASGPFCSHRGRLLAMRLTALLYVVGSAIETLAGGVAVMSFGRFVSGIGAGASTVIVPLYISEIAPPKERGFFGAFTQISINIGIVGTQTLGYFFSHDSAWRWVLGVGVIVAAAQGLGLLMVPESPAWLAAQKGEVARARRTLQRIRGKNVDIAEEVRAWGEDGIDGVDGIPSEEQGLLAADDTAPPTGAVIPPVSISSPSSSRKQPMAHLGFFEVVRDPLTRPAVIAVVGAMFAQVSTCLPGGEALPIL